MAADRGAPRVRPGRIARDLIGFAVTVISVLVFRWEAGDLIWGLWASSLVVGFAWIATAVLGDVFTAADGSDRRVRLLGGVGVLLFFSVHFGMFHYVHSIFVNHFFPLIGDGQSFPGPVEITSAAVGRYWPVVAATLISRLDDFPRPGSTARGLQSAVARPYANVIRMHLLIFVFAALAAFDLQRSAILPVIAVYFFPWGAVLGRRRGASTAPGEQAASPGPDA